MLIERSFDYALIGAILSDPKVYVSLGDDTKPAAKDFQPVKSDRLIYLIARDNGQPLGLFLLFPRNSVHAETHFCMLPCSWGERARIAGKAFLKWIWQNTPFERLTGNIQERNRLAIAFAIDIGCQPFAVNPGSVRRGGKLLNEVLVGISRPENI